MSLFNYDEIAEEEGDDDVFYGEADTFYAAQYSGCKLLGLDGDFYNCKIWFFENPATFDRGINFYNDEDVLLESFSVFNTWYSADKFESDEITLFANYDCFKKIFVSFTLQFPCQDTKEKFKIDFNWCMQRPSVVKEEKEEDEFGAEKRERMESTMKSSRYPPNSCSFIQPNYPLVGHHVFNTQCGVTSETFANFFEENADGPKKVTWRDCPDVKQAPPKRVEGDAIITAEAIVTPNDRRTRHGLDTNTILAKMEIRKKADENDPLEFDDY